MPSRQLQHQVLGSNPDQEMKIGDEPFCAAVVYFLLHTEPFVPYCQANEIKILISTGPIRTTVAHSRWHVRCFVRELPNKPRGFLNQGKRPRLMNEFLLLALVVIYLTISYPPKSKQLDRNDGERTRRFFGFIGKKARVSLGTLTHLFDGDESLQRRNADPS